MDQSHYYCLCGVHVLTGAKAIGYIVAVFGSLLFGQALVSLNAGLALVGMICIAISVALVYAQRTNNPNMYLPFLVVSGVGILFLSVFIMVALVMLIVMPSQWQKHMHHLPGSHFIKSHQANGNAPNAQSSASSSLEGGVETGSGRFPRDSDFSLALVPGQEAKSAEFSSAEQGSVPLPTVQTFNDSPPEGGRITFTDKNVPRRVAQMDFNLKEQGLTVVKRRKKIFGNPSLAPPAAVSPSENSRNNGREPGVLDNEWSEQVGGSFASTGNDSEDPRKPRVEKTASFEDSTKDSNKTPKAKNSSSSKGDPTEQNVDFTEHRLYVARMTTIFLLLILLMIDLLGIWFQSIVYRAYLYTREDEIQVIPPPTGLVIEKTTDSE